MITYIVITALLVYLAYRWFIYKFDNNNYIKGDLSFVKRYKKEIGFVSIIAIPILACNLFLPKTIYLKDGNDYIKAGNQQRDRNYIAKGYILKAQDHPFDPEIQFNYIKAYTNAHRGTNNEKIDQKYLSEPYLDSKEHREFGQIFHTITLFNLDRSVESVDFLNNIQDTTLAYLNYAKALTFWVNGNFDLAETYFRNEIKLHQNHKKASYKALFKLFSFTDQGKKDKLFLESDARPYLDWHTKREYFFNVGNIPLYLETIYTRDIYDFNWFVFITALLVSLVWLFYIRSLDVFDKDRWTPLLVTFTLGAIFSYLCYFLYDYAEIVLNFSREPDGLNLLSYCILIIGGSEEIVKLLPWLIMLYFTRKINEPFDFLLYAGASALGFAFAENLIYYDRYDGIIQSRALMAVVTHVFVASVVAYSIVLKRYKYKDSKIGPFIPFIGFFTAMFCHGIYDFFLMTNSISFGYMLTLIYFFMSLHIWSILINNSLNNSEFYNTRTRFKFREIGFYLAFSLTVILMFEYVYTSYNYGTKISNSKLIIGSLTTVLFIAYMVNTLRQIRLEKGKWNTLNFLPNLSIFSNLFKLPDQKRDENKIRDIDLTGLELRFYAPKDNAFVGHQFPVSGKCKRKVTISNDNRWYLVKLNQNISINNCLKNAVFIRVKDGNNNLLKDKVEVIMLAIPDKELMKKSNKKTEDYFALGRVYSRPK